MAAHAQFEEWIYGGRKGPKSHGLAHLILQVTFKFVCSPQSRTMGKILTTPALLESAVWREISLRGRATNRATGPGRQVTWNKHILYVVVVFHMYVPYILHIPYNPSIAIFCQNTSFPESDSSGVCWVIPIGRKQSDGLGNRIWQLGKPPTNLHYRSAKDAGSLYLHSYLSCIWASYWSYGT